MTIRSEGQFNTVVYEEEDLYRGQERRDVILINPDDMRRLGLAPINRSPSAAPSASCGAGWCVPTTSGPATRPCTTPKRTCSCPRDVDPQSKTPAFKSVLVEVVPA